MMIDLEVDEVDQHNFLNEKVSHLEDQMRSLQRPDACLQVTNPSLTKSVVISVWEHTGVRSTGSDHKPIWVRTSTWVMLKIASHLPLPPTSLLFH